MLPDPKHLKFNFGGHSFQALVEEVSDGVFITVDTVNFDYINGVNFYLGEVFPKGTDPQQVLETHVMKMFPLTGIEANYIEESIAKEGYVLYKYSDGTWGYKTAGGQEHTGYKNKGAASSAGGAKAKAEANKVVISIDKGVYVLKEYGDGTWGYSIPGVGTKKGYKNKGAASSAGNAQAKKIESEKIKAETEKKIAAYSNLIEKQYGIAVEEMSAKLKKFMAEYAEQNAAKAAAVAAGELGPEEYKTWREGQALRQRWMQSMCDTLATDLLNADRIAASYVNDIAPGIFAENFNFATYEIESGLSMSLRFDLYDKDTVKVLLTESPELLPEMALNESKDLGWNKEHVRSALTQGILQGESVPRIAARIADVAAMDYRSAMRSARTMCTAAENMGRMECYRRAQDMGVQMRKQWMATLDGRTRHSHRLQDMEIVDTDKKFSNGCRFPGDPSGPTWEVYNCRCTLIAVVEGAEYENMERNSKLGSMTYEEWKDEALQKTPEKMYEKVQAQYDQAVMELADAFTDK